MNKLRFSRFLFLVSSLVFIAVFSLLLLFRNSGIVTFLVSPFENAISAVNTAVSAPFRALGTVEESISDVIDVYRENASLKNQLITLEAEHSKVVNLESENASLKLELNFVSEHNDLKTITSKVTNRSSSTWFNNMFIGAAKKDGVKKSSLVTSKGSVVGFISGVYATSSRVTLLTNQSKFSIPVKIETTSGNIFGILTSYDDSENYFIISELNSTAAIDKGAKVVTSGLDSKTVAELLIGSVEKSDNDSKGIERKVYVKPSADFSDISAVTVIGE